MKKLTSKILEAQFEQWYGVDFDGTLAKNDGNFEVLGEPVPLMIDRVKKWIADGKTVKVFTARAASTNKDAQKWIAMIKEWCVKYIGQELDVTAEKDPGMVELWDDRAVHVSADTGIRSY